MNELTAVAESSREVVEAKRRLEGIVESAMDAIITINAVNNIILFNPAAERMFGVSRALALGQPISRFIPQRYRSTHDEHIRRFRNTGVTGRTMGALGAISGLRADGQEFPIEASISQVEINGENLATVILRDITERMANEDARLILAREVDHRAKNVLAVVQALVALTTAPTPAEFIAAVQGRVAALARAHSLLAQNRWKGGSLTEILKEETEPYSKSGQISTGGPEISLGPNAVQPISLLVHELATNAVKYGSLSTSEGRVEVSWRIGEDDFLHIRWTEHGGPAVTEPVAQGFGSTLIRTLGAKQLGGEVAIDWRPDGIIVDTSLPPDCYHAAARGSSATSSDPEANRQNQGRLLVVEDETLVALQLCTALRDNGWQVLGPAGTLEEAYRLLAENDSPDAALLDVNLRGEMVYPLADLLEARDIPFLFCSGYEMLNHGNRYRHAPIVRKPTSFALLITELRKILPIGRKGPSPQFA